MIIGATFTSITLTDWLGEGSLAFLGSTLLVMACLGRFLRTPVFQVDQPILLSAFQRVAIGLLGGVLILPAVRHAYFPESARTIPSDVQDQVAPTPGASDEKRKGPDTTGQNSLGDPGSVQLAGLGPLMAPAPAAACPRRVEYFGLKQEHVRRLRYGSFGGDVYVYVGDIVHPKSQPFDVHVFVDHSNPWRLTNQKAETRVRERNFNGRVGAFTDEWTLKVRGPGSSRTFAYAGRRYTLTVKRVEVVLIGTDQIVLEICEA